MVYLSGLLRDFTLPPSSSVAFMDASTPLQWLTTWGGIKDKAHMRRTMWCRQTIEYLKLTVRKIPGTLLPADELTKGTKNVLLRQICGS